MSQSIEHKTQSHALRAHKEVELDGKNFGYVAGYAATWDIDRTNEQFAPGAFAESLADLRSRQRNIRMLSQHDRGCYPIGIFPSDKAIEDDTGLFVEGFINLDTQRGREAYALLQQGALSDFSVGFSTLADSYNLVGKRSVRVITKATLWEVSIVDEPMNPAAIVTDVKSFKTDLPLAPLNTPWDRAKQHDYVGLVGENLQIIPRAVFGIAADLIMSKTDDPDLVNALSKCYSRLGRESPFERGLGLDELRNTSLDNLEKFFKDAGLNAKAAKFVLDAYITKTGAVNEGSEDSKADKMDDATLTKFTTELRRLINA